MRVSSIALKTNPAYTMSNCKPLCQDGKSGTFGDTSFNSLNSLTKKTPASENLPQIFDSINQWKKFCHKKILGEKLNVIA